MNFIPNVLYKRILELFSVVGRIGILKQDTRCLVDIMFMQRELESRGFNEKMIPNLKKYIYGK